METLRVFEAFAGYGSQAMALRRLADKNPQFKFEVVGISEIDKYAVQAYNAVHGNTKNYGDISKIDWNEVPDFDLFTYSFPCTDISLAGEQRGLAEGSGTRSSLLWECEKAIENKRPKYLLMENVAALVSDKFRPYFNKWQVILEGYSYRNYAEIINAKDMGVPQNRDRIFLVSIRDDAEPKNYYFPKPVPLTKRLIDVLEPEVDEKYYVDANIDKALSIIGKQNPDDTILGSLQGHASTQPIEGGVSPTLGTTDMGLPKLLFNGKE